MSDALMLAKDYPNKPWARRWLRLNRFMQPEKIEKREAKRQRRFVRGAAVTSEVAK